MPVRARLAIAVLAGMSLALAAPPYDAWPLAPAAVAALSLLVRGLSGRRAAGVGFVFGLAYFLTLIRWLHVIGWDAVLVLSVLQAGFFAPFALYLAATYRFRAWPVLHASGWVLLEAVRSRYPLGGFPWGKLAFGVVDSPFAALAALGGSPAVSAAVAGAGAVLAMAIVQARQAQARAAGAALAGAVTILLAGLAVPLPSSGPEQATVALVQGNVPRSGLALAAQRDAVLTNHLQATHELAEDIRAGRVPKPDMVIWPENAADDDPFREPEVGARMRAAVEDVGVDTLIGTVLDVPPDHVTNTAIVWSPETGPGQRYTKRKLVPFGEYIPARDLLTKFIGRLSLIPRDFLPGQRPGVLQIGGTTVGDVICFEIAFDGLVRETVRDGGRLLVVQTNNATYGRTGQPEQQLAISRLRSIEHGRAMVIAATSGISGIIEPDGSVREQTAEFTRAILVDEVPLRTAKTLATRVGAWAELVLCLPALVLVGGAAVRRGRERLRRRRADARGPAAVATVDAS